MKRNRILLISPLPEHAIGGIATWTKGYIDYCNNCGITVDIVDTAQRHAGIIGELNRTAAIFRNIKKRMTYSTKYQIAHLNTSIGYFGIIRDYIVARALRANGIPVVLHFHCDIQFWDRGAVKSYFIKKTLKTCSLCFVLCNSSKHHLFEKYKADSVLVPNYIDDKYIVDHKDISDKIKKILFTGRISINKGALDLLEVAKRFPNIEFILAGKMLLTDEKIDGKNITLLGEVQHDRIIKLLDECDAFILPSYSEGFSIALMEAMARGVPCIATNVGANADMLDGQSGIIVNAKNPDAIEEAISSMQNRECRMKLSRGAIQKVKNNYTLEKVMKSIISEYKRVNSGNE